MRQRVQGEGSGLPLFVLQLNVEAGGETIFTLPEVLQALARLTRLVDAEPEERLAPEGDDVPPAPVVHQQLAHQRMEAALDCHRPGLVADLLVRHGVDPEVVPPQRPPRLEIRHLLAMQVAIEHAADDLPAGADEGLAMADLLAAWVTTEKAERRIGVAKTDDWLQRITL